MWHVDTCDSKNVMSCDLQLTYADFAMYLLFEYAVANLPGAIENHPTLAKLKTSVEKLPNIARWLRERPATVIDL